LYDTFVNLKRMEAARFAGADPGVIARSYSDLY
jgi:hypothetical protein